MAHLEASLELARSVAHQLEMANCPVLLIGALALAAHGYPRHTEDLDFAVAVLPSELRRLAQQLASSDRTVTFEAPDGEDPLGGVITITSNDALRVQVVNFDNSPAGGFPALVKDALTRSSAPLLNDPPGRLPTPEDLILFKVYAGGPKSELDILELLTRCKVDIPTLRECARGYGMTREVDQILLKVDL